MDNVSFHLFPKNAEIKKKWIIAMRRDHFQPSNSAVVCSDHFTPESFVENFQGRQSHRRKLYPNAVPSIFAFQQNSQTSKRRTTLNSSKPYLSLQDISDCVEETDEPSTDFEMKFAELNKRYKALLKRYRTIKRRVSMTNRAAALRFKFNCKKKTAAIKTLRQSNRRLTSRNTNLKSVVEDLYRKNFINQENIVDLRRFYNDTSFSLVKNLTMRGVKVKEFPAEVRAFATTLHFYSPRAYGYVRKYFSLPHPATLRTWYSKIDCQPGFCEPAFEELNRRLNSDQRFHYEFCSLVADEINLKQHLQYDKSLGSFFGYVDKGLSCNDSEDEATGALVLMAVGLRGNWKLPLAYFLVSGVTGHYLSSVIKECVSKLYREGVTVTSVTCDGTSHNLSALELLGASLSIYDDRPYFSHPSDPARRVCVFLDVPHMIKLIRNSFESLGVIVWKGKGKVSWQFINDLLKVQNEHGLSLANKLTERHIIFMVRK